MSERIRTIIFRHNNVEWIATVGQRLRRADASAQDPAQVTAIARVRDNIYAVHTTGTPGSSPWGNRNPFFVTTEPASVGYMPRGWVGEPISGD